MRTQLIYPSELQQIVDGHRHRYEIAKSLLGREELCVEMYSTASMEDDLGLETLETLHLQSVSSHFTSTNKVWRRIIHASPGHSLRWELGTSRGRLVTSIRSTKRGDESLTHQCDISDVRKLPSRGKQLRIEVKLDLVEREESCFEAKRRIRYERYSLYSQG